MSERHNDVVGVISKKKSPLRYEMKYAM